ncbi:MAG: class I SAM-dependent DNA methyltransferase [Mesorhizobium sp.]|nr:DNA methyltransferase [Mesorhizobium sp.]MCO5161126.1 class I SAM-dependent DNA methyltransferase [Mesorhizobium sp.]
MTPHEFIKKWKGNELTERASAQEHFIDLCRLFDHPTPTEADRTGEDYAFEKGVTKTGGGDGFADVWKRGHFAWEYKKRRRNLDTALEQLTRYASALENPPLHVACDTEHFKIVTAWTNTVPKTITLSLEDLLDADKRAILHAVLYDPAKLKPQKTRASLTAEAANRFSAIAERLQHRNPDREAVAHFVNQLVFCFFAEDTKLLPEDYFTKLLRSASRRPQDAKAMLDQLFGAMEKGGFHGVEYIAHFNGGLFDGRSALDLQHGEIDLLVALGSMEWDLIDPTIFGTLFERFLDPDKRAQIGAHYTDPDKIMMIVEPVVVRPLLAEWAEVKARIEGLMTGAVKPPKSARTGRAMKPAEAAEAARSVFLDRLRAVRILDPACGSGNFLYLALHAVKDIENRVVLETEAMGLPNTQLLVGPEIVRGIELNPLAAELARTTIWIGYIQWKIKNAIYAKDDPILRRLDNIECRDALVTEVPSPSRGGWPEGPGGVAGDGRDQSPADHRGVPVEMTPPDQPAAGHPPLKGEGAPPRFVEAEWPEAEFIVGNPPFLGGKKLREGLGDDNVETLFAVYDGRVPREADLVTYWFEKSRMQIATGKASAAGLVSTNSIRGGANRKVVERLMHDADLFDVWSDEPWIVDGAAVRVSLVCFRGRDASTSPLWGGRAEGAGGGAGADAAESTPTPTPPHKGEGDARALPRLNGLAVPAIFSDLSASASDLTTAKRLKENAGVSFQGVTKGAPFEVSAEVARDWLRAPLGAHGRPNSDILRPIRSGGDIVRRREAGWVVDFTGISEDRAAYYEDPFRYVQEIVKPVRLDNRRELYRRNWWLFAEARQGLRAAILGLSAFIVTPKVSKHRIFARFESIELADNVCVAVARDDNTSFGILESKYHNEWALRSGAWLGVGNDPTYTPTTTFETFPFPEGLTPNLPAASYAGDPRAQRIAEAAKALDEKRRAWLNPPDLVDIVPEIVPTAAPGEAPVRYPDRILPKNADAARKLKERTLTNLYNQRPQWLAALHDDLDRAVAAAYGWPEDISTDDALARLLALNLERAAAGR